MIFRTKDPWWMALRSALLVVIVWSSPSFPIYYMVTTSLQDADPDLRSDGVALLADARQLPEPV